MRITENLKEEKYVAFLDVLGFKDLVAEKGEKLNRYFEIIKVALREIKHDKAKIDSRIISDSIILACEISNTKLGLLLKAVQTIQSRCAIENIWLRGAITIGDIHFNRTPNIVVGNGLIQAYLIESQEKFPRIVINPKIIQTFNTRSDFVNAYNIENNTPLIFSTNSSSKFIENDSLFVEFAQCIIEPEVDNLDIIYNHLKLELYMGQQNYIKYLWLKNYFSEAICNILPKFNQQKFLFRLSPEQRRIEAKYESYLIRLQAL